MDEEKIEKKKRKVIHKIGFILLGALIAFLFISLFNFIFSSDPEFVIYLNKTEVDYLIIKSGFESTEEWNITKFEECANLSYYSSEDWYEFIYWCMGGIGLEIMYSNVTRELINFEFLDLNCERINEETFLCEKYLVVEK